MKKFNTLSSNAASIFFALFFEWIKHTKGKRCVRFTVYAQQFCRMCNIFSQHIFMNCSTARIPGRYDYRALSYCDWRNFIVSFYFVAFEASYVPSRVIKNLVPHFYSTLYSMSVKSKFFQWCLGIIIFLGRASTSISLACKNNASEIWCVHGGAIL